MARYRTTVRSPWSQVAAFTYMSDLSNFSAWDPGIDSARRVAGEPGAVGSMYDLKLSGAFGTTMTYEIVAAEAPHRIEARSTTPTLESIDVITVDADGDGSIVTYDADLRLRGPLRLADPLLALAFRRIGDRAADGLRRRLDGEFASR